MENKAKFYPNPQLKLMDQMRYGYRLYFMDQMRYGYRLYFMIHIIVVEKTTLLITD